MTTENSKNTGLSNAWETSAEITPEMINEIYREATRLRAEATHKGIVAACRALRRAVTAIGHVVFTSEARRHA